MKRQNNDTDMSFCIRNGVSCYPIYVPFDVKVKGKIIRKQKHWYLEVVDNGRTITGTVEINKGMKCDKVELQKLIKKTYKYYSELITKKQKDGS